ncbi:MAG: hypothetical protein HEQ39_07150 [Rhizobacter sp.]
MATSRSATKPAPSVPSLAQTTPQVKLRQSQAEYTAARPLGEPGPKAMMSSSKMYVCRRCGANFKTGEGKPHPRMHGLGTCNVCLAKSSTPPDTVSG